MTDICHELESLPEFQGLTGACTAEVDSAQSELELTFADDYRRYLQAYSVASANGHELTGICNFARLNVTLVTSKERPLHPAAESTWYVIERVGIDGALAWQDADGAVFITTPQATSSTKVADSLIEYLNQ